MPNDTTGTSAVINGTLHNSKDWQKAFGVGNNQNNKLGIDMNNWQPSSPKTSQGGIDYTKDPICQKVNEATQQFTNGYQNVDGMNASKKQDTITMLRGIPYTRADKDKFNEVVSNTSMGLAGIALVVPGGQGVAAASLAIGSAITLGNNIFYEVVYSDGRTINKVGYITRDVALAYFNHKYKVGEKFFRFWEKNMHLLKGLPKFKTPTLEEIKRMGETLNIFQNKSTEVLVEKTDQFWKEEN